MDTDRFRNDDRRYDELHHQIFVGLYCEYLALHHDVDVMDDHDQNCVPDVHDGHHHAAHELDGHDQSCEPDDLNDH